MSLYRESGGGGWKRNAGIGAIALVVGLGAGFGIGRGAAPDPTGADLRAQLTKELAPIASGLEIIPTEYGDVAKGEGGESAGVTADLDAMRRGLSAARADLQALDPAGLKDLTAAVDALDKAVTDKVSGADFQAAVTVAKQKLAAVPGGD